MENYQTDLNSLAAYIVKECENKSENVSESLAIFVFQLLSLNLDKSNLTADNESELTDKTIQTLLDNCNPASLTMKLQVYFDLNYRDAKNFLTAHESYYERNIKLIANRIVQFSCFTGEDCQRLYKEIVYFIMMQEIVDYKSDANTFKEIERALSNVLPINELYVFLKLEQLEKKKYLYALAPVVAGLYLHNWCRGKARSKINNVAEVATGSAPHLAIDFMHELKDIDMVIDCTQGILYHDYFFGVIKEDIPIDITFLQSYLVFLNQYRAFLGVMMKECKSMTFRIMSLEKYFQSTILCLNKAVSQVTVDALTVFSLYSDASNIWKTLKNELLFLSSLLNIFVYMKFLKKSCRGNFTDEDIKEHWKKIDDYERNEMRKTSTSDEIAPELEDNLEIIDLFNEVLNAVTSVDSRISVKSSETLKLTKKSIGDCPNVVLADKPIQIDPDSVKNFDDVYLKFEGFCPWALVYGNGLVIKGKRHLGIVMYKDHCYAFCSEKARKAFCKDPNFYLDSLENVIASQPQLLVLLNLSKQYHIDMSNNSLFERDCILPIFVSHCGVQTELHPVEKYNEVNYQWNQWTLRKLAIQYANIRNKKTHSSQTSRSSFQRDKSTQVYIPKENSTQTKRDYTTQTSRPGIPPIVFEKKTSIF